jgi:hypothetical protein
MHASAQILAPATLPIPTRAIGFPAADATTIIDHGGSPEAAAPRQLNCGMASLEPPYAFPTAFIGGPNLFGQGADVRRR